MTSASLAWGSAFLAFGPSLSLLFVICYKKAQLIIVVTTSAFFFLLSVLVASMLWWIFELVGIGDNAIVILLPGIISQFVARCAFVWLYYKVEAVIETSIEQHEAQHANDPTAANETARLRLELNDWASGIAAGTGFGGMHAILFYGTLLTSEANNLGTLYQTSCPGMPSLVTSALFAFFFSFLDVAWMLFTFYGMRRRNRPSPHDSETQDLAQHGIKGNAALAISLASHTVAAFCTALNSFGGGCRISLPLVAATTITTIAIFWSRVSSTYLPVHQKRRMASSEHVD